jgi:hypothetical protein
MNRLPDEEAPEKDEHNRIFASNAFISSLVYGLSNAPFKVLYLDSLNALTTSALLDVGFAAKELVNVNYVKGLSREIAEKHGSNWASGTLEEWISDNRGLNNKGYPLAAVYLDYMCTWDGRKTRIDSETHDVIPATYPKRDFAQICKWYINSATTIALTVALRDNRKKGVSHERSIEKMISEIRAILLTFGRTVEFLYIAKAPYGRPGKPKNMFFLCFRVPKIDGSID